LSSAGLIRHSFCTDTLTYLIVTSEKHILRGERWVANIHFYAGLDSASTFTIVQSLANWAHATDATIVISLLQPEPQVYDLFDDVLLMANGRIVYQGPRGEAVDYFSGLGFVPPPQKATADFLQVSHCVVSHNHAFTPCFSSIVKTKDAGPERVLLLRA
jgi:hypothetical protein